MILHYKKISTLALLLSSGLVIAGTVGPVKAHKVLNGFYAEGSAGAAFSNWTPALNYIFPSQTSSHVSNVNSGFTAGGDLGYKLNPYFSLEVGALSLPKVSYSIQSATQLTILDTYTAQDVGSISNWLVDFVGKVTLPVGALTGLDVFGKFGLTYRAGNYIDNELYNGEPNIFIQPSVFNILEPILGAGLQYHLGENWVVNAQYLFVPYGILSTGILGPNLEDHGTIPSAQIVTGGIGFYF